MALAKKGGSERKKSCFEIALNMEILPTNQDDKSMVSLQGLTDQIKFKEGS